MSHSLMITCLHEEELGKWSVSVDDFICSVVNNLEQYTYKRIEDKCIQLEGCMFIGDRKVYFYYANDGQNITIENPFPEDASVIAELFRKLVPYEFKIYLYDGGYDISVEILPHTSREEISKSFWDKYREIKS